MCLAADITKSLLPRHSSIDAGTLIRCESRAASPTLVGKRLLTISAAQASSLVLGLASIIFKQATPKLRISSQCGDTLVGGSVARCGGRI